MRMRTLNEATKELQTAGAQVSEQALRRWANEGRFCIMNVGNRVLVDLDEVQAAIPRERLYGVGIGQIMALTGMSNGTIRRGIKEGWLPHALDGRGYFFDPEAVISAIRDRMRKK